MMCWKVVSDEEFGSFQVRAGDGAVEEASCASAVVRSGRAVAETSSSTAFSKSMGREMARRSAVKLVASAGVPIPLAEARTMRRKFPSPRGGGNRHRHRWHAPSRGAGLVERAGELPGIRAQITTAGNAADRGTSSPVMTESTASTASNSTRLKAAKRGRRRLAG